MKGLYPWVWDRGATDIVSSDEYCPHCDNHYVLEALTPKPKLSVQGEDARIDARILKDDRLRAEEQTSIFNIKDAPHRLG